MIDDKKERELTLSQPKTAQSPAGSISSITFVAFSDQGR